MRRAWLGIPVLSIAAASAGAQWQATADGGVARLEQTGIPTSNAYTAGAAFDAFAPRAWLRSSALVVLASDHRATAQALVLGSFLAAPGTNPRWELSGALSGFGETSESSTTTGEGMARVRFDRGLRGASFGFGGGAISHAGNADGLLRAQAEAYVVSGDDAWAASLSAVRIPSMIAREISIGGSSLSVTPLRGVSYADGTIGWRHETNAVSLSATAGVRAGFHAVERTGGWATAEAALWLSSRAAVVVGAGRTLDDAVRGVPRTTFGSVSLRLAARPHVVRAPGAVAPGARLTVVAGSDGRKRIEVRGVEGARLEVTGDFTDWQPVELQHDEGVWFIERQLSSGLHRIALRVDGGDWTAPVNLPHRSDDLGGVVGLITIP